MHTPSVPGFTEVLNPDDESVDPLLATARSWLNRSLRGRLEVDYDIRTVTFRDVAGDVAMRLHALVAEHADDDPLSERWADRLDPRTADAGCRWITFRPARVLSIRWFPEHTVIEDDTERADFAMARHLLLDAEDAAYEAEIQANTTQTSRPPNKDAEPDGRTPSNRASPAPPEDA